MAIVTIDAKGELAEFIGQTADLAVGGAATTDKPAEKAAESKKAPEPAQKAAQSAEEAEVEDPDDVEGDDGLTPRQKRELSAKMLKAIGKKHREMKEAEEFAAAQYSEKKLAEQRAAAVERELADLKAKAQPVPRETADPEAGKPKRDKFDSDEKYWEAVIDWRADQKIAEQRAKDAKAEAERRQAEVLANASARISKAIELVPDYQRVVGAIDTEVPPAVAGYMQKSEMFAELGYHLAKNPQLLASLAKLPPDEQLVTIGKIEGTLKPFEPQGSKTTNGATPSKAATNGNASHEDEPSETGSIPSRARGTAPVITPLNSASGVQVEKDRDSMSTREVISAWTKEHRANLNLRKRH